MYVSLNRTIVLLIVLAAPTAAVDGIAITTHRVSGTGDWHGFRVHSFGSIVRHDITASRVVRDTVIYAPDSARCVVMDQSGSRVAFMKRTGRIQVLNIDGAGLSELPNAIADTSSWLDWPAGDWVYYMQESIGQHCCPGWNVWDACTLAMNLRRVNAVTGDDEAVAALGARAWQLGMSSDARPGSGRLTVSGPLVDSEGIQVHLFDLAAPSVRVRSFPGCGASMGPSGNYVTVNQPTHKDVKIMGWDGTCAKTFHMNAWALPEDYDGREVSGYWTAHRWSCNSDKWVFLVQGADFWGSTNGDAWLYNWQDEQQIRVTRNNPAGGDGADDPEDFWVDRRPRFNLPLRTLLFTTQAEQSLALTNGGETGTLPQAGAAAALGKWLRVSVSGSGNSQAVLNQVQVSGLAPGEYLDSVTVSDPLGSAPPIGYAVRLLVGPYLPRALSISPTEAWIPPGGSVRFSALVRDQFGQPFVSTVSWSVPAGSGSVTQQGEFSANPTATGPVQVKAECSVDTTISGTAVVTVATVPSDSLVLWLRADSAVTTDASGRVTHWLDLSPAGGAALPPASGTSPRLSPIAQNGLPAVTFDGSSVLDFPSVALKNFTVFAAYSFVPVDHDYHFLLGGARQGLDAGGLAPGYSACGLWQGNPPVGWLVEPSSPAGFSILTAGNTYLLHDGIPPSHYTYPGPIASQTLSRLGGRPDTTGQEFSGALSELLIYSRSLPDAERQGIERYLRTKYRPDQTAAPITVLAPNGGEVFSVGDTMMIRWSADVHVASQVVLRVTVDDGANWTAIPLAATINAGGPYWGGYPFAIPDTLRSASGKVAMASRTCRVAVLSYLDPSVQDESDYPFTISAPPLATRPASPRAMIRLAGSRVPLALSGPAWVRVFGLDGRQRAKVRVRDGGVVSVPLGAGVYVVQVRSGRGTEVVRAVVR